MDLVSVIVPVYNVEKYLSDCIDSIINQTYKNIEVILVDDGSPDGSGKIADDYAERDKRVKVIHKENGGVASARNVGIRNAKGAFITFVDSDDWIATDYIEYLLKLQKINDADMSMAPCMFKSKHEKQSNDNIRTLTPSKAAALLLSPNADVGSYSKLYRKSWLIANGLYQNESLFSGEGLHYMVTAAEHANCVTVSDRKIYYYRKNVAESATTKFNIKMYTNNELSLDIIEKDKIVNDEEFDAMLNLFRIHLKISGLIAILINSSPNDYPNEYERWKKEIKVEGQRLLHSKYVSFRSKLRIVLANTAPHFWAKLVKYKKNKTFKESVEYNVRK